MTDTERPLLLTVLQAASLLHISRSHAYQLIQQGAWPVVRFGRSCRVPAAWLTGWVEAQVQNWERACQAANNRGR